MTHCVTPPDQTVWWDRDAVASLVLGRLRLQPGDVEEMRITRLVDVAGEMINDYLDQRCDRPATPGRENALIALTMELYGRRDIPVMGAGGGTRIERVDTGVDQARLDEILSSLAPKRERWGLA